MRINRTSEQGIEYVIRYRLIPREVSPAKARHTINAAVLHALHAAGISLAYPRRIYTGDPALAATDAARSGLPAGDDS